jgi:hypothetical protein
MQPIIVALEAIGERIDTIEIKFMERLKALEAKYEFSRYVSNHSKRGSKKWKSDCNSTGKSTKSTTPKLIVKNDSSTESTTGLTTDAEVNVVISWDKTHTRSKSKTQLNSSNTSTKSIQPRHNYQMHIITTGDENIALGFGKIANRKIRIFVHSGYDYSLIDAAFLSKLGCRMNRRKRRPPPQFGAFMINEKMLPVICRVSLPIKINGITRFHNMFVVDELPHQCIIAADFINKHKLLFDNQSKTILFEQKNTLPTDVDRQQRTQKHQPAHLLNFECEYKASTDSNHLSSSQISTALTSKVKPNKSVKQQPRPGNDSCYRPPDAGQPNRVLPEVDMDDPRIREMSPRARRGYQRMLAFFVRKESMSTV